MPRSNADLPINSYSLSTPPKNIKKPETNLKKVAGNFMLFILNRNDAMSQRSVSVINFIYPHENTCKNNFTEHAILERKV